MEEAEEFMSDSKGEGIDNIDEGSNDDDDDEK